jgi:cytochrome P450
VKEKGLLDYFLPVLDLCRNLPISSPYKNHQSEANKHPTNRTTAAWSISNIAAGSDTTAITLRTIFYHLHKYPETLSALLAELRTAKRQNRLSEPVTWKQAQQLPYLEACIKEAGRIHPAFGLPLERVVPAGGAKICGEVLPQGTVVGVHQWAAHRAKSVFGEDVDVWRPERWLVEEGERKGMEKALLTVSFTVFPLNENPFSPHKSRNMLIHLLLFPGNNTSLVRSR